MRRTAIYHSLPETHESQWRRTACRCAPARIPATVPTGIRPINPRGSPRPLPLALSFATESGAPDGPMRALPTHPARPATRAAIPARTQQTTDTRWTRWTWSLRMLSSIPIYLLDLVGDQRLRSERNENGGKTLDGMCVCVCVCVSVCVWVCLGVSGCVGVCLCLCLRLRFCSSCVCLCVCVSVSVCVSVFVSVSVCACVFVCDFVRRVYVWLFLFVYVYFFVCCLVDTRLVGSSVVSPRRPKSPAVLVCNASDHFSSLPISSVCHIVHWIWLFLPCLFFLISCWSIGSI
jgi:hypothetical protein